MKYQTAILHLHHIFCNSFSMRNIDKADFLFYIILSEIIKLGNIENLGDGGVKNTINPKTPLEIM